MSSLSSQKDHFIAKIEQFDSNLAEKYVKIIENYVNLDVDDLNTSRTETLNRSIIDVKGPLSKVNELEQEKKSLIDHISKLETKITTLKKTVESVEAENTELNIKLKDLKTELTLSKMPEETPNIEYDNLINEIRKQHDVIEERNREIDRLQGEIQLSDMQHGDEVSMFKEKLDKTERRLNALSQVQEDFDNLKLEMKTQKSVLTNGKLNNLQNSVNEKNAKIESMRAEKMQDLATIGRLNQEIKDLRDNKRKTESLVSNLTSRLEELESNKLNFKQHASKESLVVL